MKATILVPFRDKHDHKVVYAPGEVKDFDNDRVVALAARGLVKPLEEIAKEENPDTEKPAKKAPKPKGKGKKDKEADADADAPNPADADAEGDGENPDTEDANENEKE